MATDGPTPPPCDPEILKNGRVVILLQGSSNAIENWVKRVAERADAKLDWHYVGGVANILHLGDEESLQRVHNAIEDLWHEMPGPTTSRQRG